MRQVSAATPWLGLSAQQNQVRKIGTINSIEELDGYEAEARGRGLRQDEVFALTERRRALSRKGKR